MGAAANPFSVPEPWDDVAAGYAETSMEFMGQFSQEALRLTEPAADASILDVACGPGTLTLRAAPLVERVTAIDFAPDMVAQMRVELDRHAI
jgi:ubiquinone/menaquinone biosynthesis C-methylase UbiE